MANVFNIAKQKLLDGTIDLTNDTIRVCLLTVSPNADLSDTQLELADLAAVLADAAFDEATDATYTGQGDDNGRRNLASKSFSIDTTANRGEFTAANVTWTALNNFTIQGALIYKFVTNDAGSTPIAYFNINGSTGVVCNGGDIILTWDAAAGILTLT